MPEVSIIMPVFNGEAYIAEAIESALAQEGVDFEILIGDNASTDGTVAIVRSYEDPRIVLMTSEIGLGVYGNLNRLVRAASAPVIKVLCADDTILPGGLKRQLEHFTRFPDIAFACCWPLGASERFGRSESRQNASPEEGAVPPVMTPAAAALAFAAFGNLAGSLTTAMARRDAMLAAGLFNQHLAGAGDYDLWARLAVRSGAVVQKEELVYVREHDEQASRHINAKLDMIQQIDAIAQSLYRAAPPADRHLLRWHFSLNLVSQHWNRVVRARFTPDALAAIWVRREYAFGNLCCLALFIVTLSRRLGCRWPRRRLLSRINTVNALSTDQ